MRESKSESESERERERVASRDTAAPQRGLGAIVCEREGEWAREESPRRSECARERERHRCWCCLIYAS